MITNQYFLIWYTIKLELIPKILISLALYFDVFYLKEINLFYQFFWILIIPFLFNGLILLIQKNAKVEKKYNITILNDTTIEISNGYNKNVISTWLDHENTYDITKAIEVVQGYWYFLILKIVNSIILIISWSGCLSILLRANPSYIYQFLEFFKYAFQVQFGSN